jgi:hypothetical protein
MLLRNHPLLTYRNSRSWPPTWVYCGGLDDTHPRGEVGILKTVYISVIKPPNSCHLIMEYAGAEYMGTLYVSDAALCLDIFEALLRHCGKAIQEIGNIDLSNPPQVSDIHPHQPRPSRPVFLPAGRPWGFPTIQRNHFGATRQRISAVRQPAPTNAISPKGNRT